MILIFDSHPVQYKAPVYQRLQQLRPDRFQVIYACDASLRGHQDREFGQKIIWDTPLLEGYASRILHNENGTPFAGFRSLRGRGVFELLRTEKPAAVLISQFLYAFDLAAYLGCRRLGIPIWIRHETQDEAFARPAWKAFLRGFFYRAAYAGLTHAFAVGELNREHLLRHGVPPQRISLARYCTPFPAGTDVATQEEWRQQIRARLAVGPEERLVLFSGKLIDKKNPGLILEALRRLSPLERTRFQIIFVGSGPLEASLRAAAAEFISRVHFAGFINQSEIAHFYAAADLLILPSRQAGETWGLVVNEALQAGCGVIMTRAVGSYREFGDWERVRVIPEGDAGRCAEAMSELANYPRSFDWCADAMKTYSVEAAAEAIAGQIDKVEKSSPSRRTEVLAHSAGPG